MNSGLLVDTLKKELKKRSITYKSLAGRLRLSEAAVKRLFAERNFSLKRLDEICAVIGVDFGQLTRAAEREKSALLPQLSDAAEVGLAADPDLLTLWYALALGGKPAAIRKRRGIDKPQFYRLTRRLESLGLLEVLPKEEIRLTVSKSARWRPDGPLARRYGIAIRDEFFASDFGGHQEKQEFLTGALTPESFAIIRRKLEALFREFDQLSELDSRTPEHQVEVFWFYAGIRPWAPERAIQRSTKSAGERQ